MTGAPGAPRWHANMPRAMAVRSSSPSPARRNGLATYALAWLGAGTLVAVGVVALAGDDERPATRARAIVPAPLAPPVREVQLGDAMRNAGCDVERTATRAATGAVPPAGVYRRGLSADERRRVARAGLAVIEYAPGATGATRAHLVAIQRAAPTGTVLAPRPTLPGGTVTVTTFGRRLRCPAASAPALDAVQLYRGRYLGSGPGH